MDYDDDDDDIFKRMESILIIITRENRVGIWFNVCFQNFTRLVYKIYTFWINLYWNKKRITYNIIVSCLFIQLSTKWKHIKVKERIL